MTHLRLYYTYTEIYTYGNGGARGVIVTIVGNKANYYLPFHRYEKTGAFVRWLVKEKKNSEFKPA